MIEALADVMVMKGVPEHLRSDNGPEFVAQDLRKWLARTGAKTAYIEPGSPWENGFCESGTQFDGQKPKRHYDASPALAKVDQGWVLSLPKKLQLAGNDIVIVN